MLKPVSNPPNPWDSTHVEYLGEPPEAALEVFEEESRSILAENESPDVGFRWSLNPYRGCFHACSYCTGGETPVLMSDGRTRPIADLRVGDDVYGRSWSDVAAGMSDNGSQPLATHRSVSRGTRTERG
jgi:hypothetical protein